MSNDMRCPMCGVDAVEPGSSNSWGSAVAGTGGAVSSLYVCPCMAAVWISTGYLQAARRPESPPPAPSSGPEKGRWFHAGLVARLPQPGDIVRIDDRRVGVVEGCGVGTDGEIRGKMEQTWEDEVRR